MNVESSKSQSTALRLLKIIYDRARFGSELVFVTTLGTPIGLTEDESQAAWRYLRDRGLIQTFNIPGTARINAAGIDTIEGALRDVKIGSVRGTGVSVGVAMSEKEEWISARDALSLLGMKTNDHRKMICKRAHVGLIKARAARFIRGGPGCLDSVAAWLS